MLSLRSPRALLDKMFLRREEPWIPRGVLWQDLEFALRYCDVVRRERSTSHALEFGDRLVQIGLGEQLAASCDEQVRLALQYEIEDGRPRAEPPLLTLINSSADFRDASADANRASPDFKACIEFALPIECNKVYKAVIQR